ncbi:hypothetical protein ACWN8B_00155 [Vagococcus zengguangii]|uniref:Uncharacterized protein n=1 Tax=Vagococcus zengguangii TaxID=2571750 RepID=A0A4D7CVP0_9ENTE|nr:hypothetical protein [Vagococcus zengguangii]QCI86331.1 hypothetical protein FA707_04840 [Vagococcus zengguangii]
MKSKKKSLMIAVCGLLIIGGIVYKVDANKKAEAERIRVEQVNKKIKDIELTFISFEELKDSDRKLESLKKLIKDYNSYEKSDEPDSKILKSYEDAIKKEKDVLKKINTDSLKSITSKDVSKEGKDELNSKIKSLESLKQEISGQENVVYSEKEFKEINDSIVNLIKNYTDKVKEIEKKEAEEKAKKEKEAKEKAEKEAELQYQAQLQEEYQSNQVNQNQAYSEQTSNNENSYSQGGSQSNNQTITSNQESTNSNSSATSNQNQGNSNQAHDWNGWSNDGAEGPIADDLWADYGEDGKVTIGAGDEEFGGWQPN